MPEISVIIPTHNRAASLERTLHALRVQSCAPHRVEVIAVADGCVDNTVDLLQAYEAPFSLRFIEQPGAGPAVARNAGAREARGALLLFLDDDIEASPGLVTAHLQAHAQVLPGQRAGRVAMGYLPPLLVPKEDFFQRSLRIWWESIFEPLRRTGHRFLYTDLLSGNFSLAAALFWHAGGFDVDFSVHEDYELGYRLLKGGAEFAFVEEAWGYHHEQSTLSRILRRKYEEGRADVLLGLRHPELRPILPLTVRSQTRNWPARALRHLAASHPHLGDRVARLLKGLLAFSERVRNRKRWGQLLKLLFFYWYWRGVVDCLPSLRARLNYVHAPLSLQEDRSVELDLETGLKAAEEMLDALRPDSVRIRYGRWPISWIPPVPGAERLRGVHLRQILASTPSTKRRLLGTLALEHAMNPASISAFADALADNETAPGEPTSLRRIAREA